MIVPFFKNVVTDFSGIYSLREIFWFGRSSCTDPKGFFCNGNPEQWITKDGWYSLLRGLANIEDPDRKLLWLYAPDFIQNGTLDSIKRVPSRYNDSVDYWT
jgi:hypothetical protein